MGGFEADIRYLAFQRAARVKKPSWSLRFERVWPWVASAILASVWKWGMGAPFPSSPDSLFGAAATVASILASFLGVSKAIILSIKETQSYKIIAELGYRDVLFAYLRDGILCAVIFAFLSIIGFFVEAPASDHLWVFDAFKLLWVFFGAASLFSYSRITNLLFKLLRHP
jgi:hypothetical protein